jgi:uncharacterized Rossmann fold enzyme
MKRLNVKEKQKTSYCIPLWLRDEQIKIAIQRVKERVQPGERRDEPVAVVGFGPSLNDTWEQVRNFKFIISCSGAHKFLVDRGIIPTHHVEVDPRKHKVHLIGQPQAGTEYLIASTCHPDVFKHLEGFNVKLWHVFDASEDGKRLLPPGEWALTGGCDVGMRAMSLAAFLGFRELHCFGIDGNARDAKKHAADHPNALQNFAEAEYPEGSGKMWLTNAGMLEAARQIWHELDVLPAVNATFYGDGLIQTMAKDYKRPTEVKPTDNIIAFAKPELITEEYRAMNEQLHSSNLAYGVGGSRHAKVVLKLCEALKSQCVLDYGCGKGYLAKELPFPIWEYDPAVPGKQEAPRPADIVTCTDVLEHIEPELIDFVIDDIRRVTLKVAYLVIHTGPAGKTLPDGRNTHLIQKPRAWWEEKLSGYFKIGRCDERGMELHIVAAPLKGKQRLIIDKAA